MKKSSGKGYWEKQVDEFCDIFGFKVDHRVLPQDGSQGRGTAFLSWSLLSFASCIRFVH